MHMSLLHHCSAQSDQEDDNHTASWCLRPDRAHGREYWFGLLSRPMYAYGKNQYMGSPTIVSIDLANEKNPAVNWRCMTVQRYNNA